MLQPPDSDGNVQLRVVADRRVLTGAAQLWAEILLTLLESDRPLLGGQIAVRINQRGLQATGVDRHSVNSALYSASNSDLVGQSSDYGWQLTPAARDALTNAITNGLEDDVDVREELLLRRWQERALDCWRSADHHGIVEAVTGAGKTIIGIAALREFLNQPSSRAAILVTTRELADQWHRQVLRWTDLPESEVGLLGDLRYDSFLNHRVLICIVNTAASRLMGEAALCAAVRWPTLLIADECHRYGAPTFALALRGYWDATLGLSATPERSFDEGMATAVMPALGTVIFRHQHDEAIAQGDISDFQVHIVRLHLTDLERYVYTALSDDITHTRARLEARYPQLRHAGVRFFPLLKAIDAEASYDTEAGEPLVRRFESCVTARTWELFRLAARWQFVKWLADSVHPHGKLMLFCTQIAEAEWIAERVTDAGIPCLAHHSRLGREERRAALEQFAAGTVRAIAAPKTLDEGIDVPDADCAVLVAGSCQQRQRIQRMGRVLRARSGKCARVIVLVAEDTREDMPDGAIEAPDRFFAEMARIGRVAWWSWPEQSAALIRVCGDAQADPLRAE